MAEFPANPGRGGKFFRLKAHGVPRRDESELTSVCFDLGASGVAEDLAFVQKDLCYDPDVLETPRFDLDIYFLEPPREAAILALQSRFPEVRFDLFAEENRDWMEEWKKGFKPFLFSFPFWVVPTWLRPPPEAGRDPNSIIYVEPGMAFGTGTHETTRLAAQLVIEEVIARKPRSLLDVGTGTGILALVASRLGVSRVVGLDNDPEARRTARENLERNRVSQGHSVAPVIIADVDIKDIRDEFEVVVANIIDGVLTLLMHDLNRTLRAGGRMILSGVLTDREDRFYQGFVSGTGLRIVKRVREGEWSAALLEKPS